MEIAIEVLNLYKSFGKKIQALNGVSLSVERGIIFGLLGPNGAGKTTLVRILSTLLSSDSGTAIIEGINVSEKPAKVREIIGLTGQYTALDENMSGYENILMVGRLYGLSHKEAKEKAVQLLEEFALTEAGKRLVRTYSGGMRRRLDLAASLVGDPKVLFLDEPTTGLDPHSRIALWSMIENLAKKGTTVLLTTQYLEEADTLAKRLAVLDHGKIIAEGTPKELKTQVGGDVVELHLRDKGKIKEAVKDVSRFGTGNPHLEEDTGKITLPVKGGASVLVDIIRFLDEEKIFIEDINLRRPTLDEVFLKLTGHEADERGEELERVEKNSKGQEIFVYENE